MALSLQLRDLRECEFDETIAESQCGLCSRRQTPTAEHGVEPVVVFRACSPLKAIALVRQLQSKMEPERWLLPQEAAKVLAVSQDKIYAWIREGRLSALNVANPGKRPQYRIPKEALLNIKEPYKPKILK